MIDKVRYLRRAAEDVIQSIGELCAERKWEFTTSDLSNGTKLHVQSPADQTTLNVHHNSTSAITSVVYDQQGSAIADTIDTFLQGQASVSGPVDPGNKESRCAVYKRLAPERIAEIRSTLNSFPGDVKDETRPGEDMALRLSKDGFSLRATLYSSGTLVLQGRNTALFDELCTQTESVGQADVNEIAVRFVTTSLDEVERISALLSPALVVAARERLEQDLGRACFHYLSAHDSAYVQSSYCLLQAQLTLPEYSCLVMPASKGLEGYCRKLMVSLNVCTTAEIERPDFSWGATRQSAAYQHIYGDKETKKFLDRVASELDFLRNFMMHSSGKTYVQVTSGTQAEQKVKGIVETIKQTHQFFQPQP